MTRSRRRRPGFNPFPRGVRSYVADRMGTADDDLPPRGVGKQDGQGCPSYACAGDIGRNLGPRESPQRNTDKRRSEQVPGRESLPLGSVFIGVDLWLNTLFAGWPRLTAVGLPGQRSRKKFGRRASRPANLLCQVTPVGSQASQPVPSREESEDDAEE